MTNSITAAGPVASTASPAPVKDAQTLQARAEIGTPDPPASETERTDSPQGRSDRLSVLATRLALETELSRATPLNAAYASCVGSHMTDLIPPSSSPAAGSSVVGPTALAQKVSDLCAKPPVQTVASAKPPAPYTSIAAFQSTVAEAGSDGTDVLSFVLESQLAFRLQTEKHLYRCISDGYLAQGAGSRRPLMFRALMASLNGYSNSEGALADVILLSVQSYCADEQFQLSERKP